MSANNQILVAKYKGRWYVWSNITAEAWDKKNEVSIRHALASFATEEEAMKYAFETYRRLKWPEYGVRINELAKDGAKPTIVD